MQTEHTNAFAMFLQAEHRRLHELLRRIEGEWLASQDGSHAVARPHLVEGLQELRAALARHFMDEERGGCLEEAICVCPSLLQEAGHVEGEHPALLAQLDKIIASLSAAEVLPGMSRDEARQEFKQFVQKLHDHEAAENRVLQFAFGVSADA